ncbi:unnamed protein product [Mytilus coruscus]|uniref:Integrase core domain-containing protein n=1 Tax=Mytilus coruscus TaxID=42192 RepID=A0A6J8EKM8_MYTCO|nr:unnamed protein product [Mytilus coruscus]
MHLKCIQSGFNIPRDTVSQLMKIIDPDGVKCRLSRKLRRRQYASPGPNFAWHIDSYDKLKRYGIAINGFSRYMAVKEKADFGTENVYVANMQKFLCRNHNDEFAGDKSYLSGKSKHIQRIERFWGILIKQMVQYYMDLFADLCKDGHDMFCGDFVDKSVMQFCFMDIIQYTTYLQCRGSLMINRRNGSPCVRGRNDTKKKMCDETVFELCTGLMTENNLMKPYNANECKKLYVTLRQILKHELDEL